MGKLIKDGFFIPATQVASNDPLYILYTSGTTGSQRESSVKMVDMLLLSSTAWNIYGVKPGEVYWAASDIGGW